MCRHRILGHDLHVARKGGILSHLSIELLRLEQGFHYHLYAYKLEDLVSPDNQNLDQSRVAIRYNVTFFRVGYHRSQPFLVITTETVRVLLDRISSCG